MWVLLGIIDDFLIHIKKSRKLCPTKSRQVGGTNRPTVSYRELKQLLPHTLVFTRLNRISTVALDGFPISRKLNSTCANCQLEPNPFALNFSLGLPIPIQLANLIHHFHLNFGSIPFKITFNLWAIILKKKKKSRY